MLNSILERIDLLRSRKDGEEMEKLLSKNQNNPELSSYVLSTSHLNHL